LAAVNRYFEKSLRTTDIVQSFSGVRPLYDDNSANPSAVTRDYLFDIDGLDSGAPLLSVFGGKITTFRKLAEHAIDKLSGTFPNMGSAWTAESTLPGGDIEDADFDRFVGEMQQQYSGLDPYLVNHFARLYGSRMSRILSGVSTRNDLGKRFSTLFYEVEARYLMEHEWAHSVEDILRRRTKHGLHMNSHEIAAFEYWIENESDSFPTSEKPNTVVS